MTARGPVPGAGGTLFRGYAPLVALMALILAMAVLAPTIAPERDVVTRPRPASAPANQRSSGTPGVAQERQNGTDSPAPPFLRSSGTAGVAQERRNEMGPAAQSGQGVAP